MTKKELIKELRKDIRRMDDEEKILTRKEVLKMLDISARTMTNWVRENKIPYTRIGRRLYFLKSEIMNLKF